MCVSLNAANKSINYSDVNDNSAPLLVNCRIESAKATNARQYITTDSNLTAQNNNIILRYCVFEHILSFIAWTKLVFLLSFMESQTCSFSFCIISFFLLVHMMWNAIFRAQPTHFVHDSWQSCQRGSICRRSKINPMHQSNGRTRSVVFRSCMRSASTRKMGIPSWACKLFSRLYHSAKQAKWGKFRERLFFCSGKWEQLV